MNQNHNSNSSDSAANELRRQYDRVLLPVYSPPAPVFVRGAGSRVWDADGREYVDFGGGIAVLSLGHAARPITDAVCAQVKKMMHTSNLHANDAAIGLANMLSEHTFADRVFLCNSGAEANEAALKLARHRGVALHADKFRVLSFTNSFHGRVGLAMSATGQDKIRQGFGPLAAGFCFAPFNDSQAASEQADDNLCAIIVEPVQGEGGVIPADDSFLQTLRTLADRHNALLIYDEIQTGAGRCGELYAYMTSDAIPTPDVLTSAKGLGGGFPVAAMICSEKAADGLPKGAHGSTYGGNPTAAAAACAVLNTLTAAGFMDSVKETAREFHHRLTDINKKFNCFGQIRACGMLIGCEMVPSLQAADVAAAALNSGLIVITAAHNTLRFAPALNIKSEDIREGFDRLEVALAKL